MVKTWLAGLVLSQRCVRPQKDNVMSYERLQCNESMKDRFAGCSGIECRATAQQTLASL